MIKSLAQRDIHPYVHDRGGVNQDVIECMIKNGSKTDDIERIANLAVSNKTNKLYADYVDKSRQLYDIKEARKSLDGNNDNAVNKTVSAEIKGKNTVK